MLKKTHPNLSHPKRFETRVHDKEDKRSHGSYSKELSNEVLETQKGLVADALAGGLTLDQFTRSAANLERLESRHAQLRGDGFETSEKKELERSLQEAGLSRVEAPKELATLYQDLLWGDVSAEEATEELNWRSLQSYGEVALDREGVVYGEERYKIRAALFDGHAADTKKPTYDGPYHEKVPELINKAIELFPLLDENSDDIVDRIEARNLLTYYDTLELKPGEAATLYSRQADMAKVLDPDTSGESLTMADLEAMQPENRPQEMDEDLKKALWKTSVRLKAQLKAKDPEPAPFALGDEPNPLKVKQGKEGSCWALCNLPPLAGPELASLVHPDGEQFQVTLPDGRTTQVEPLNPAERRVYSNGDGAWSGILEKGLSQILEQEGEDINGGFAMEGRRLLSGHKSERHYFDRAPDSDEQPDYRNPELLFEKLEHALENGAVLAAALKSGHEKGISKISASGHAYTVLALDGDTVRVRNPWGRSENADRDGTNDGVFELTRDEFFGNFSYIYTDKVA